jgi:hypothetical protein
MDNYGQSPTGGFFSENWGTILIGILIAIAVGVTAYFILGRADTRPVVQGFYGGAINGTTNLPCGRNSSEAQALLAMFQNRPLGATEEGKMDLRDLRNLLSRLTCMKEDLMAPQHLIAATKELGFATHMDIQPVADLIGRCFSKTVPERDLTIQFDKWNAFGKDMIRRLCTAGNYTEAEVVHAEKLLGAVIRDVQDVANTTCITPVDDRTYGSSPRDPKPSADEGDDELRPYDGYY